jgi:phage-related tail protein
MVRIAREMKENDLRDAAKEFHKAQKESSQELADRLAEFAVAIATNDGDGRRQATSGR